jgi:hypothetical protein
MIIIFSICSLIMLPAYLAFTKEDGIKDGTWAMSSIGSLIFSSPQCYSAPLEVNSLMVECPNKKLQIDRILSIGLISDANPHKDQCVFNSGDKCAPFVDEAAIGAFILAADSEKVTLENTAQYIKADETNEFNDRCTDPNARLVVQISCV